MISLPVGRGGGGVLQPQTTKRFQQGKVVNCFPRYMGILTKGG